MKTLGNPPPGIQASGSRSAARPLSCSPNGARRQGSAAPRPTTARPCLLHAVWQRIMRDGRLRREPDAQPFLRLAKDVNQMVVDKTS